MIRPSRHKQIMAARRRRYRSEDHEFGWNIAIGLGLLVLGFTLGPWQLGVFFGGGVILVTLITEPTIRRKRLERRRRTGRGELHHKDFDERPESEGHPGAE